MEPHLYLAGNTEGDGTGSDFYNNNKIQAMKNMILAAIFMIAVAGTLSAQTTKPGNGTPGTNKNNPGYVDANNNNTCDNYENNTRPANVNRGQGQGRRGAGYGMGNRQGRPGMQCRRAGGGRRS